MYKKLLWIEKLILEMCGFVMGSHFGYECAMKQKEAAEQQEKLKAGNADR